MVKNNIIKMNAWIKYGIQVNDWDRLISLKFQENCKDGNYCDVGACNGVITKFFKHLAGENGKVYSFELNPYNYNNIKSLSSDNCIVENMAVSDESGEVELYSDNMNPGNHISNIVGYDTAFRKMNSIGKVKSISLDEYFKNTVVDYLKIDVEGAELKVIKGAINTLKNCKFAVIECHFKEDWNEIYSVLKLNNLDFKNLVDDVPVYYGETIHNQELERMVCHIKFI